jgi:DNA ligase-associated metallophosphoesterase
VLTVPEPATRHERLQNHVLLVGICARNVDKSRADMANRVAMARVGPCLFRLRPERLNQMFAFTLARADVLADPSGALWWPSERVLVLADLHFEKGSSYAVRTSQMLPPYDTRATLAHVSAVVARHAPSCIICLGDNFHDAQGPSRLDAVARESLAGLMRGRRFVWIEGNHDAAAAGVLGGDCVPELRIGPLVFRHEPGPAGEPGEVAGHLHPVITVDARARRLRRKCFVSDGVRCVLPSLGSFTGGLDVTDEAFSPLFPRGCTAYALGREKVYPFPVPAGPVRRRQVR